MTAARQIRKKQTQVEQAAPELAQQLKNRTRQGGADGDIHRVSHRVVRGRKQIAAKGKELKAKPPKRRWQRASALPAMPELPGYHLEYVRRDNRHRGDNANLSAHIREGWDFARAEDFSLRALPTTHLAAYGDVIGNDDSVLMKIDVELKAERDEFFDSQRDATTRAINRRTPKLDVEHQHMPIVDAVNKHSATLPRSRVRRNRDVSVAED
jgi:hypothetical protein